MSGSIGLVLDTMYTSKRVLVGCFRYVVCFRPALSEPEYAETRWAIWFNR